MITYNLNTEDVSNLIKAHLCDDLKITNMEYTTQSVFNSRVLASTRLEDK